MILRYVFLFLIFVNISILKCSESQSVPSEPGFFAKLLRHCNCVKDRHEASNPTYGKFEKSTLSSVSLNENSQDFLMGYEAGKEVGYKLGFLEGYREGQVAERLSQDLKNKSATISIPGVPRYTESVGFETSSSFPRDLRYGSANSLSRSWSGATVSKAPERRLSSVASGHSTPRLSLDKTSDQDSIFL